MQAIINERGNNLIIDFHVHAFADDLAPRAVEKLEKAIANSGLDLPPKAFTDGTIGGALKMAEKNGVDRIVLLPVATKPTQQVHINEWSRECAHRDKRIIPFAAVHPDDPDIMRSLEGFAEQGFKGIKLHPDYQGFTADEERMIPIYRKCAELNLITVFHMGLDAVSPHKIHATPEMLARVFDKVDGFTAVLAHMGGISCHESALRLLAGSPAYFDTAFMALILSPSELGDMIRAFGADRVLFASDCPWNDSADDMALIEKAGLSEEDKALIYGGNGCRLLGIQ